MTHSHEEDKQYSFDCYCKKILKYAAYTYFSKQKERRKHETLFSELSEPEFASLAVNDRYFTHEYIFDIYGEIISVSDCELGKALNRLPQGKREIILMSYFFDMTDEEIAKRLSMVRRTVTYQRASSLNELKKILKVRMES